MSAPDETGVGVVPAAGVGTVEEAAAAIAQGQLVVLPTDTVYGVGADAFSPGAVNALLAAKRRGRDMPVPVLLASWQMLDGVAAHVSEGARALVEAFWPGGLSLLFETPPSLAWDLGESGGSVLLRMPLHPTALELLAVTGPLAVSSANRSGQPPATTVTQARAQLGAAVSVYLDGGPTAGSAPSTIVDVTRTDAPPRILRLGVVSAEQLREVSPDIVG